MMQEKKPLELRPMKKHDQYICDKKSIHFKKCLFLVKLPKARYPIEKLRVNEIANEE